MAVSSVLFREDLKAWEARPVQTCILLPSLRGPLPGTDGVCARTGSGDAPAAFSSHPAGSGSKPEVTRAGAPPFTGQRGAFMPPRGVAPRSALPSVVAGSGRRHDPPRDAPLHVFVDSLPGPVPRPLLSCQQLKSRRSENAGGLPEDLVERLFSSQVLCLTGGEVDTLRHGVREPSGKSMSVAEVRFSFCSEGCVWGGEIVSCCKAGLRR